MSPQFTKWIAKFIPKLQFGFLKGVGTREYGCTLMFKMLIVLERRGEGILISLDVKGAFDRVWWAGLKAISSRPKACERDTKESFEIGAELLVQAFPQGGLWQRHICGERGVLFGTTHTVHMV